MKTLVAVAIQVYNEEKNIKACVQSAQRFTQQVVVMDMQSTDKTTSLAKKSGAEVISTPRHPYVEPVRKLAFTEVEADWIFILDADERITPALAQEIQKKLSNIQHPTSNIPSITHYEMPRQNIFAGKKWLKHGGWWPDYQVRLIQKKAFQTWPKTIHSPVQVKGIKGTLQNPIKHYFHSNLEAMVKKTIRFEQIEAKLLYQANRSVGPFTPLRKFCGELMRRLIIKQGFRDGPYGIIESFYQAYSKSLTWLFLYEKYYQSKKL